MPKLAKTMLIKEGKPVFVDGQLFPWHVALEDITVEAREGGRVSVVYLPILVENVEVQNRGESTD